MKSMNIGKEAAIIVLGRQLTVSEQGELLGLCAKAADEHYKKVILDFTSTSLLDATGINVLVRLHELAGSKRCKLIAAGLNRDYINVFALTGLDAAYKVIGSSAALIREACFCDAGTAGQAMEHFKLEGEPAQAANSESWALPVRKLRVPAMPTEAINLNVAGRRTAGPTQGFGQLWEKTYRLDLTDTGITPEKIIEAVKANFPRFQPPGNRFYASQQGIRPGEIILINADTPGGLVATGVMVLYADERTFTLITPQGHPEAGWVTFRSYVEEGRTIMQIQGLARASDPVYELAFRVAGSKLQQGIWTHVLESLARHVGSASKVDFHRELIDHKVQWTGFFNLWKNAQVLSLLYSITHPGKK
jgi:anti-anti-sigma regulatory factor